MLATLGAGCFWCVEAVYRKLNGVHKVTSGYSGGDPSKASYKEVCDGQTGHAEVCQIEFDDSVISFEQVLNVFFAIHDPTTLNRQGNDVGEQYRSVIFFHDEQQKLTSKKVIHQLTETKVYKSVIVTQVEPYQSFFPAETYHDNYFELNPNQPYCNLVVAPKVQKFMKEFKNQLKNN